MKSKFNFIKIRPTHLARASFVTTAIVLASALLVAVAYAAPPAQDPRPPIGGGGGGGTGGGGGGGGAGGGGGNGSAGAACASVRGQVINWGFGPEDARGVELKTGSWQAATASASDGNYSFGNLGVGIAFLHVGLAPGEIGQLQPLMQDAGVYLNCDFPTIANIALFSSPSIDPPATLDMSAPNRLALGETMPVKLTIKNNLPNEITNVIVTDAMPEGLVALKVATTAASPENIKIIDGGDDGQLVAIFLDKLAAGDEADITITVTTTDIEPPLNTPLRNTATLFYRESAAVQASTDFVISDSTLPIPAAASITLGNEEQTPAEAGPDATAASEESFVPPEKVPATGGEVAPSTGEGTAGTSSAGPDGMPTTGGDYIPLEDRLIIADDASPQPNPSLTRGDTRPAGTASTVSIAGDNFRSTTILLTGGSAILFLMILGFSGLRVLAGRSGSPYEDQG